MIVTFLVFLVAMWAWIAVADLSPRLGLDLQGGVSANLLPAPGQGEIDEELLDQTVSTIRERVDALGVAEPDIARQGDTIQVQLPGVADQEQARDIIGRTAQLQFRPVIEQLPPGSVSGGDEPSDAPTDDGSETPDDGASQTPDDAASEAPTASATASGQTCDQRNDLSVPDPGQEVVLCLRGVDDQGEDLPRELWTQLRLGPAEVTGSDLADAQAQLDPNSLGQAWSTLLEFDGEGAQAFQEVTGRLACLQGPQRGLAIVLDNIVEQAPPVAPQVACEQGIAGGSAVVEARTEGEARDLALVLKAGALPIQLDFGTFQTVSPTLGQDSLDAGLLAGLLGLVLVAIYLIVLYRGMGLAAVLELLLFGATVFGLIIVLGETIGFTLTLAGIAGVIVSIGIAADSSIIYRERYRDEVRAGRTIRTAADHAFTKAFRTNLTGNTVSFLAAVVLYLLAVGPVRGFAFTLGLSTLVDTLLFSTFTRGAFGLIARNAKLANAPLMGLRSGVTSEQLAAATVTGPKGRSTSGKPRRKVKGGGRR